MTGLEPMSLKIPRLIAEARTRGDLVGLWIGLDHQGLLDQWRERITVRARELGLKLGGVQ